MIHDFQIEFIQKAVKKEMQILEGYGLTQCELFEKVVRLYEDSIKALNENDDKAFIGFMVRISAVSSLIAIQRISTQASDYFVDKFTYWHFFTGLYERLEKEENSYTAGNFAIKAITKDD